jgi:uncharacterized membrane protein
LKVPTPTKGYIHIGDSMVYLSGILLGPALGAIAAAVGSMFADVFSGYMVYAPATFFIKGLDAWVTGLLFFSIYNKKKDMKHLIIGYVVGTFVGGLVMVSGYLLFQSTLYGYSASLAGVPGNIVQAVGGALIAFPVLLGLVKAGVSEQQGVKNLKMKR